MAKTNLSDTIVSSIYAKYGGEKLLGQNLLDCHNPHSVEMINKVICWFEQDITHNIIYTSRNEKQNKEIYMVALRDEDNKLIGYYEKHEYRDLESAQMYDFIS